MGKKRRREQPKSKAVNNLQFLNLFELIQDISEIIKVLHWVFTTESLEEGLQRRQSVVFRMKFGKMMQLLLCSTQNSAQDYMAA